MACGDITSLALTPHAVFTSFRGGRQRNSGEGEQMPPK